MRSLLFCLIEILKEAFKLFFKNGRTMAFIALFIILTKSILFFSNIFSIKPLIVHLLIEKNLLQFATPNTPEFTTIFTQIKKDIEIFFGLGFIFLTFTLISSLLSATTTILAAAVTYAGKQELTLKNLLSRIRRIWKRPTITFLYTSLLSLIYLFIYVAILIGIMQITKMQFTKNPDKSLVAILILTILVLFISVSGLVYFLNLLVSWNLAIVISVVEDIKGIEAVEKAKQISKGMKLQGALLIVLISILNLGFALGMNMIPRVSVPVQILIGLVEANFGGLVSMYLYAVFTVFYFRCKKSFGEKVEIFEKRFDGYSMVPTTITAPIVDDNIP
ncbi:uncharacterized protein LOC126667039 [Mercurialis annua]|uniref:uncharacterized protein LOC126667039 n=1 Tax=Mercurialis annua TaxID=3986 RepID=UPI00215F9800|nr:uncharacterized protein LOC126667039 [Mercurialis annua]